MTLVLIILLLGTFAVGWLAGKLEAEENAGPVDLAEFEDAITKAEAATAALKTATNNALSVIVRREGRSLTGE